MIVWRNGDFIDAAGAVSAADRGYLIGDGVFETVLVQNGRPAFLAGHLSRLRRGAEMLDIKAAIDEAEIRAAIAGLSSRLNLKASAIARITLTRSGGARGLAPTPDAAPVTIIALHPAPAPKPHFHLIVAQSRRLAAAAVNGFKCIGAYAPNMLARIEAARAGADESVMLNEHGRVCSASAANIFLVSGGSLVTPPEREGAMPGIIRGLLLDIAAELGVPARLEPVAASDLISSPLLLTNSVIGAAHASLYGGHATAPLASRLIAAYEHRLDLEFAERSA